MRGVQRIIEGRAGGRGEEAIDGLDHPHGGPPKSGVRLEKILRPGGDQMTCRRPIRQMKNVSPLRSLRLFNQASILPHNREIKSMREGNQSVLVFVGRDLQFK